MRNLLLAVLVVALFFMLTPAAIQADQIENLVFTGTATCAFFGDTTCGGFGNGPVTGFFTFDVTTDKLAGPWSFTTPFGVLSSSDTGAHGGTQILLGDFNSFFDVTTSNPNFDEGIGLDWASTNPQELGSLDPNPPGGFPSGDGCFDDSTPTQAQCRPDYLITGATTLAPEPSTLFLIAAGLLGLVPLRRRPF
jgi:hypothetical protein